MLELIYIYLEINKKTIELEIDNASTPAHPEEMTNINRIIIDDINKMIRVSVDGQRLNRYFHKISIYA